jgi:hypothetical protein
MAISIREITDLAPDFLIWIISEIKFSVGADKPLE